MANSLPTPPEALPPGRAVVACFGSRCIRGQVVAMQAGATLEQTVSILITTDDLTRDAVDLSVQVKVFDGGDRMKPGRPAFTGDVLELKQVDAETWRLDAESLAVLSERKVSAIGFEGGDVGERLYHMARLAGMEDSAIILHGWKPTTGPVLVAIPVEGYDGEDLRGPVALTRDSTIRARFKGVGPDALNRDFEEPGVWAVSVVDARRMHDAQVEAVLAAERLVRRLSLASRYSLATTPDGLVRAYRRARGQEHIRLRPIAGVERLDRPGKWLHGYDYQPIETHVDAAALEGILEDLSVDDRRIDEAIAGWRRAAAAEDPAVAVVALSEAIEFYVAGVAVPHLFAAAQLDAIAKVAMAGLVGMQRDRVQQLIGQLNDAPLNTRLREALAVDGVHYNKDEFAILGKLRGLRRLILHGQSRDVPTEEELAQALALVNRMILFRLHRLAKETPARSSPQSR